MPPAYYIERKDVPQQLQNLFSYTGRKFQVRAAEKISVGGPNAHWSGGSKSFFRVVRLTDGKALTPEALGIDQGDGFSRLTDGKIKIEPGFLVAEHSYFYGKDHGITFHVHPDSLTKLLPQTSADLGQDEEIVLAATRQFKNSYDGFTGWRKREAQSQTGISNGEWHQAFTLLQEKKMLTRSGAITNKGKNAIGWTDLWKLKKMESIP